jgi:hypothetical protein
MDTLDEVLEIITDYKGLVNKVDNIIKDSGYKTSYLAKNLKLSRSTFYVKRKNKTFSLTEIEKLMRLILLRDDVLLINELKEIEKTDVEMSQEDFYKMLNS